MDDELVERAAELGRLESRLESLDGWTRPLPGDLLRALSLPMADSAEEIDQLVTLWDSFESAYYRAGGEEPPSPLFD